MVVMKSILDSFSRCLGSQHRDPNDIQSPRGDGSPDSSTSSSPLNAIREGSIERLGFKPDEASPNQTGACCELPLDYRGSFQDTEQDREDGNFLAHARKKASAARRHRKINSTLSSVSRKASMEKARKKSNKRKLDIFRKPPERNPSSFSKLLGSNSTIPQMLCFANPIFDSSDDDLKLFRDDYTVDEETIASTLYFDARYEHVVQNKKPVPLYQEFSVPFSESNDDIIKIYNMGSHQSIRNVYCDSEQPPPPPDKPSSNEFLARNADEDVKVNVSTQADTGALDTSMIDDTSSGEDDESVDSAASSMFGTMRETLVEVAASPEPPRGATCMGVPSPPPMCMKSEYELGVIEKLFDEDDMPPSLKLMSKNSSSTALTYVCSSKSNVSGSGSPGHGISYKTHSPGPILNADEDSQLQDWVRVKDDDVPEIQGI